MNDRELLELAAKAAGIIGTWDVVANYFVPVRWTVELEGWLGMLRST